MEHLVSVILTSYNKPKLVINAIESVLQQSITNWELIIMDDNSDEDTVNAISSFLDDHRINYINSGIQHYERHKTTRYATLINEAIPKTKGKYITYLTDDNFYMPSRLEVMAKILEENVNIEIVYSQQLVKTLNEFGGIENQLVRPAFHVLQKPAGLVDHCSVMHSRIIADQINKKYGSYWDDDPNLWFNADAAFWKRLTELQPFYPISKTLDVAIKDPHSFQRLYEYMPKILPNGILVQSPSSDIYLIDNQVRRKISPEILNKLKYNPELIVGIPDPFLYKYKEGIVVDILALSNPELFPNNRLIRSSNNQEVYLIQKGRKHFIHNRAISEYNINLTDVVTVDEELINGFQDGEPILGISHNGSNFPDRIIFFDNFQYFISFDSRLHLLDKNVAKKLKLNLDKSIKVNLGFTANCQKGIPFSWDINKKG